MTTEAHVPLQAPGGGPSALPADLVERIQTSELSPTDRWINLDITPANGRFRLTILTNDPALRGELDDDAEYTIPLSEASLMQRVQACRLAWRKEVVDYARSGKYVFQEEWDMRSHPDLLRDVLPELAKAGRSLFLSIFADDAQLRRVGLLLQHHMSKMPRTLRVTSDAFYAPWSMIYSSDLRADGSNAEISGFWGFQHLIEHAPSAGVGKALVVQRPLKVALQLDERIDERLGVKCNEPVTDLLDSFGTGDLESEPRNLKSKMLAGLEGPKDEHFYYFCCHAKQHNDPERDDHSGGYMVLSDPDDDRIQPDEIQVAIGLNQFSRGPIVFLNACEGGQMDSIFYSTFAERFLSPGASAVIGPQIEVPAVFAGEFARRFLKHLLAGAADKTVGRVLYDLRREFVLENKNPLGVIYSLYRGADVKVPTLTSPAQ